MSQHIEWIPKMRDWRAQTTYSDDDRNHISRDNCTDNPNYPLEYFGGKQSSV